MSLKFYGPHGVAKETLASGQPIPDGDFFQLAKADLENPHNIRLLEEGKLLPSTQAAEKAIADVIKRKDEITQQAREAALAAATAPEPAMISSGDDNAGQSSDENENEGGE